MTYRSDGERSRAAYPFTVENPRAKGFVKQILGEMSPGDVRIIDSSDFRAAFVRVDQPLDIIWGPSRTFEEVFRDEYGDRLRWEINWQNGHEVRVFHRHRRVPVVVRRVRPRSLNSYGSFLGARNIEIMDEVINEELCERISIQDEDGMHLRWEDEGE